MTGFNDSSTISLEYLVTGLDLYCFSYYPGASTRQWCSDMTHKVIGSSPTGTMFTCCIYIDEVTCTVCKHVHTRDGSVYSHAL